MMKHASPDTFDGIGPDLGDAFSTKTRLIELPHLARMADVGRVFVKCENERPLGNFKVLGGLTAGLRALARAAGVSSIEELRPDDPRRKALPHLICASDGNHGLSVAAAARKAGVGSVIYLPVSVNLVRAGRIEAMGGRVAWVQGTYDDAVTMAMAAAQRGEGLLVPDTSPDADDLVVQDVMAGYGVMTGEVVRQLNELGQRPTHVFVQAGVGGLAAAVAEELFRIMAPPYGIVTVEPEAAACVAAALKVGRPVHIKGNLETCAEMLSCGLASAAALAVLLRHKARPVAVSEEALRMAVKLMQLAGGPGSTPSGAAGLAGLLHVAASEARRLEHGLRRNSCVVLFVTENDMLNK